MKSSSVYVPFFSFFLLFVSVRSDLIQTTCDKASKTNPNMDVHFCVSSLEGNPKIQAATTLENLVPVVIDIATAKATEITSTVSKLLAEAKADNVKKGCLEMCSKLYSEALNNLATGGQAVQRKDYRTANAIMSSAMDSPNHCEDGFKKPGLVSPLTKENNDFFQLAVITVAFGNMVKV